MRLDPEFASGGHLIALEEGRGNQDSGIQGRQARIPVIAKKAILLRKLVAGNINDWMISHISESSKCIQFFGISGDPTPSGGHLIALEEGHGTQVAHPGSMSLPLDSP